MTASTPLFLGIDGGGTGCRARLVDASGHVLGEARSGPATLRLGADASWAALMQAANEALDGAGHQARAADVAAAAGIAGIGRPGAGAALGAKPHPFASLAIVSDQVTACLGAHGGGDGGIVIVGTGSAAYGRVGGREVRFGGLGFPVSDEGSGAWLGLEALRLALRAHDRRTPPTPLLAALLARFGDDPYRIVAWMEQATATDYAALAPDVAAAATRGDSAAEDLLARAAHEIASLVGALAAEAIPRVALVGGLAGAIAPRLSPAAAALLVAPLGDGVDGALHLAGLRR